MTAPAGFLDSLPEIQPPTRCSPSSYWTMKRCRLRGVLSINRAEPLLPLSPAARLGIAIHRLLEAAGRGMIDCVAPEDAEAKLRSIIEETESSMRKSWLDAHLVPLKRRVGSYEVRIIRAAALASSTSRSLRQSFRPRGTTVADDFEVWVESSDRKVGGFIDRVSRDVSGATIIDYKTGDISNRATSKTGTEVKPEYEMQLRIYASLFASTFGEWPSGIRLQPLGGSPVEVKFTREGCRRLVKGAIRLLASTQRAIESHRGKEHGLREALAKPDAETCRTCLFRPGCPSYMSRAPWTANDGNWPIDVTGRVAEFWRQEDGRISLSLLPKRRSDSIVRIRGLSSEPNRHPALRSLASGDRISLFNLNRGGSPSMLAEGPMTTAYRTSEDTA